MTWTSIVRLRDIQLDERAGLVRDYTRPVGKRPDSYMALYDRHTLFYDAVRNDGTGETVINAPPLLNLTPHVLKGLRSDGEPVQKTRHHVWKRSDQLRFKDPGAPLTVDIAGCLYSVSVRPDLADPFKGLNCLLALNKNNRPEWIRDWAQFHANRQGAEAAVIIDNGSTDYPLDAITDALASVNGMKAALVYDAPFPYGPLMGPSRKGERGAKFYQSAMLNMARSDALSRAGAVLSVDIDELVHTRGPRSIFETTRAHPLGMTTFKGYWGYPASVDMIPARQRDHRYRTEPNPKCNRKWCIAPDKFIGRSFPWDPHQVGGILQNLFTESKVFRHMHCRGTTTGWKKRKAFPEDLHHDPELDDLMERYLPEA